LYDEAPAAIARRQAAMTAEAGLTTLVLAALVLLLVAYLRLGGRFRGLESPTEIRPTEHSTATRPPAASAPDPRPHAHALPARDLDEALRITGGSLDIADSLLEQMLAELPAQLEAAGTALAAGDWVALRALVHSIKGGTAVCAVPALHAAVCRLQAAARRADRDGIVPVLTEIDRERRRLLFHAHNPGAVSALATANAP